MQIVTLTTDLGLKDHYVASLKGQLLTMASNIQIVDISHLVKPFDIAEASFYINNVMNDFPDGTIHFLGVDSIPSIEIDSHRTNSYPIAVKLKNQYFVGADNGIFSLLNDFSEAEEIVRLDFSSKLSFRHPFKNIYMPTISAIINGSELNELGERISVRELKRAFTSQAVIEADLIKGSVIHVDNYENVIVNVTETLFHKIGKGHPFTIFFRKNNYFIDRISDNYNEVPNGEKLALFNENGWLEIALNKGTKNTGGGAASLLGLKAGDLIRIEFSPKGSKDRIDELF